MANVAVRYPYRKSPPQTHPARRFGGVGRKVDVDDLVSAVEIAARLGAKRSTVVYDWRRRQAGTDHPFPEPLTRLGSVHVWAWPDVEKWARKTGRL